MPLAALALRGKERKYISQGVKSRRKAEAYSLLYFTLSALHSEEAQLMRVELHLLNFSEGKRGLEGAGDVKSILQEGQFQVEAENLNLWICLLGTGDVHILKGNK